MKKEKAKTVLSAEKTMYEAFKILKENGGEMRYDLLRDEIAKKVEFNEWEKETYKTGILRWDTVLRFYSIDASKTGYIIKKGGVWYLTEEGEKSIELGKEKLLESIRNGYRKWNENRKLGNIQIEEIEDSDMMSDKEEIKENVSSDEVQANSRKSFTDFIDKLDPYEFQDLCAALLRGMGYYTPFVAPKGKDGRIDIIGL